MFIGTLNFEEEEQKLQKFSPSKIEQILSQNDFSFEVTAQSETLD